MTGRRDLPPLQVQQQTRVLCEKYQSTAKQQCETGSQQDSSLSCQAAAQRQGQKCQRAMQHAAKRLNVSGCLRAEQQVILCEMEWCDSSTTMEQCRQECEGVRQVLRQCIDKQIDKSLRAFGLEPLSLPTTAGSITN